MTKEMRVYLLVRRSGRMTASTVASHLGITDMQAMKALQSLYADGGLLREKAQRRGTTKGRAPWAYWVDPAKRLCADGCACSLCCA